MKVINLLGGPGTGKSSTGADLFALMKWAGYNVELIDEYAKKVTWEGHQNVLRDQIYLFAKQNRKLERLRDQVEYVITDSPLILCDVYTKPDYYPAFSNLVFEVFHSYENINIMLRRKKEYVAVGRNQTESEAREVDTKAENLLINRNIPYYSFDATPEAKYSILNLLKTI